MISYSDMKQRQSLSLSSKIVLSRKAIEDFYQGVDEKVYVAFSGGKDSTALLHLVRSIYPDTPGVFSDTGLEYPEIRDFVKTFDNIEWVKPELSFNSVLKKYGYPVISKKVARCIRDLQNPKKTNYASRHFYVTGEKRDKTHSNNFKVPKKWLFLAGERDLTKDDSWFINPPFRVSEQCCDIMKKQPFDKYERKTGRYPYIGVMACDSEQRRASYLQTGCNSFKGKIQSKPIAFWYQKDIITYIKKMKLNYCKIYDGEDGAWLGEKHTGCIFCMFGIHLQKEPNRFQRMALTHPKLYRYCMDSLELDSILKTLNVSH